ncbi:MAG: NAD(P)-binding domain-containing protein, partial [Phycisphaerae bacterium]|nr:NAD(P)-binding domain-containing protein [Phycisphaerae bacterium]
MTETRGKKMDIELGVIGGGNMAEAAVRGALDRKVLAAGDVLVADPEPGRRAVFEQLGVATTDDNPTVVSRSRRIVLAVKPQIFADLADVLGAIDPENQPIFSIMTGISNARLAAAVG